MPIFSRPEVEVVFGERAVLEPGGTLTFFGKKPNPEATRHAEITRRLDRILEELASLRMRPAT